jgi:hypothetical protein
MRSICLSIYANVVKKFYGVILVVYNSGFRLFNSSSGITFQAMVHLTLAVASTVARAAASFAPSICGGEFFPDSFRRSIFTRAGQIRLWQHVSTHGDSRPAL